MEREKQVATVFEQFIVTPQSAAHLPTLFSVSCILIVAAGKDSEAFQSVKSSAWSALLILGCVFSTISLMKMLKRVGEMTPPSRNSFSNFN